MPDEPDETQAVHVPAPTSGSRPATGWLIADRYRVVGRIGSGGMAEVFRAHDESLNRDVAVKVFKSGVGEPGGTATSGRQSLELQSLARLNHPHLITLFDGSMTGPGPSFLVMELVHGNDLAVRLERGPLPPTEVRTLGAQLAEALAYVHSQGLAHRDVKPANILLGDDGRARLSDFGIVRLIGSPRMTSADLTVGTAAYVAPEQARGGDIGTPADVYSLGLVLIESLTGRRCFDGPMLEAMAARLTRPPHIPAALPPPWSQLLTAMTAIDPAARPTATQVAQTLRGGADSQAMAALVPPAAGIASTQTAYAPPVAAGSTRTMPAVPPPPPARRPPPVSAPPPAPRQPSAWRGVLITAGILALLAIIGLIVYSLASGSGDGSGGGGSSTTPAPASTPMTSTSTSPGSSGAPSRSERPSRATRTRTSEKPTTSKPKSPSTSRTTSSASSSSSPPSSSAGSSSSSAKNNGNGANGQGNAAPPSRTSSSVRSSPSD